MGFVKSAYAVDLNEEWPLAKNFPTLGSFVSHLLPMVLVVGGVIFFVMVIASGFAILSGAGSDDEQTKAKWHQILTAGVIGLVLMFSAYWIVQIINFLTGNALGNLL